ncbi:MAG: phenylalanine--tRNA ligase subunit beta [Actinomycetaceae bacterium]|nr:phenylalanine--tRNA ligase subunit beta [Actinomycetaceae bacterium]
MPYVSKEWLASHVELREGTDLAQIAADLVRVGLEEERIVPPAVQGPLVVGEVLSLVSEKQKNGKIINYCRVDVGQYNDAPGAGKEPTDVPSRGIVCGAHNFGEGDLVAVVLPGGVLPGPFPISSRKTYGHISDGMICSERELGMSDEHDGILVLTEKYSVEQIPPVGESLLELFGFGGELLEINVTPDRGYCFSMRGIAREYSHSTGGQYRDPAALELDFKLGKSGFPVVLKDDAMVRGRVGCNRFVTRIVRGVDPQAKSPAWLVRRLEDAGMRSLSLTVDVTNYVMLDLGQPMHAYDLESVNAPLTVRRACAGEKLTTLDQVERNLDPQDLLITDGEDGARVLALAGVMGGAATEVSGKTTDVLLEAAHFDTVSVARTARRHKLPTESAKRFERGVDAQLAPAAIQLASDLLAKYGGGVPEDVAFEVGQVPPLAPIELPYLQAQRLTGVEFSPARICQLLEMIGCTVSEGDSSFIVTPPSWRPDLVGPAHLVEEIARLDGYDNVPSVLPVARAGNGLPFATRLRRDVTAHLASSGLTQVLSYPFSGEDAVGGLGSGHVPVRLANPLAGDQPYLRTSVLDTLLPVAALNVARGNESVAIYEVGKVYWAEKVQLCDLPSASTRPSAEEIRALHKAVPIQPDMLGVVMAGPRHRATALEDATNFDWADAVQVVKDVAGVLGIKLHVAAAPDNTAPFHPVRVAQFTLGQKVVGYAGELHPDVIRRLHLPPRTVGAEVDLQVLIKRAGRLPAQVKPISSFPAAKEDIALVVAEDVPVADVQDLIESTLGEYCEEVRLFDIYRGGQVGENRKSLAFAMKMRAADHTLSAEETAGLRKALVKRAQKKFKAKLRAE